LRHFAGHIAHRLSPVGMLTVSAALSAVGLYALSFAYSAPTAIAAATVYGLGIVYFWPTMLGVTAERFPRGGAFLLGLMGCVGNLSVGLAQPMMGRVNDQITFAAIPADIQQNILVVKAGEQQGEKVIDPEKVKALPADQQKLVWDAQSEGA